jgi:GNAT superfamily N-acetyltransferase
MRARVMLMAAALAFVANPGDAQILPWEVTVAEIEAGHLRNLAQRLNKQYVLYQLHLGDVRKSDLVETAARIDRILESLEQGSPTRSIPAPWTPTLREQVRKVDGVWGPLRRIAVASPYDHFRVSRDFMPPGDRRADPLLIRYFDDLSTELVSESTKLLTGYHEECIKTGLQVCPAARSTGYAAMLIERGAKEAVYVVAGIEPDRNRTSLKSTIAAYHEVRRANNESPFFAAALDPQRGVSAKAAGALLASLRQDWDAMQVEFAILAAGDEQNFDLRRLLDAQTRLVEKVERLTAALVRYASLTYGS